MPRGQGPGDRLPPARPGKHRGQRNARVRQGKILGGGQFLTASRPLNPGRRRREGPLPDPFRPGRTGRDLPRLRGHAGDSGARQQQPPPLRTGEPQLGAVAHPGAATDQEARHPRGTLPVVRQRKGRDLLISRVHPQQPQARPHAPQVCGETTLGQGEEARLHLPLGLQPVRVQVRKDQQGAPAGQGKSALDLCGDGPQPGAAVLVSHALLVLGHTRPGQARQQQGNARQG